MTVTVRNLVPATQLTTSAVTLYTATNVKAVIDSLYVTNTTASPVTVTVYIIPSAGSASATTTAISAKSVAAGETLRLWQVEGQSLESGGFIQALASANTSLSFRLSGREIS